MVAISGSKVNPVLNDMQASSDGISTNMLFLNSNIPNCMRILNNHVPSNARISNGANPSRVRISKNKILSGIVVRCVYDDASLPVGVMRLRELF
jgi:hypothetical protein